MTPPFDPSVPEQSNFAWLVGQFIDVISVLVAVVFAATFVVLLWKIIQGFIIGGGDEFKITEAKKGMLAAVIMLIIMAAIWGIVALLRSSII